MVLNITYSFTALSSLSNLQVWLGTSDDWIGSSDRPTKEQGSFVAGSFVATAHGKVLRVESGEEAVFVFSPHPESHAIILQHYGNWPAVTAATSSDLERSTSDGAYAIYVPLGPLAAGETKKTSVFYAAAAASQLSHLLRVTDEVAKSERPTTSSTAATTMKALRTAPLTTTTTTQPGLAVLQTDFLKIAVLKDGSLGQPFYMSDQRGWTKLTYASKKLDYAIKVDGKLAAVGGDPAVESSAASSLATRAQMTLDGSPKAEVLRSYNFLGQGMVLNVTYTFTALAPINELEVWLGTSDDWIGSSDRPSKEQGSFRGGSFVPAAHGQILRVQSGEESVFIFSPNPDSHAIILEHYGNWPAVSASKRSDLARSTSDGAYAVYVPLGSLSPGQKISATIFYAAAGADRLQDLLRVAEEVKPSSTSTTTWLMPSTSTTPLAYVLQSPYLKIGLLGNGGLGQPFYKSTKGTGWTKLTYSQLHLSTTVKIDGEIADLGRRVSLHFRDAEYCTVTEELSVRGVTQAVLKRTYSFTGNGLVFQANFSFQALKNLDNVEVWFGTSDDWIGTTDRPLKEQGKFVERSFEPTEHGHILRVHSGDENVFVFSTHPDSHAIIRAEYGRWSLIHAARHSELASSRSDGAYGIYVPLGSFRPQASHSASFFYAAAEASRLAELLDHASAVDGGDPASSTTVGTPPSTTSTTLLANMLETSFLRFKLLDRGGLGQPFYYSPYAGWTQLTYANKSLECTVKVDGNIMEVDSDRDKVKWWDYENAMATTQLRRQGVPSATLTRSYGFKQEGMIFMANFSFTALTDISSLEVWLGTSDDYIGVTDQPTKLQGDFGELGTFEAKRNGDVLHIYSGQESVLMFSPNQNSQAIILRHYGRWHEIEVSTKSDLHESSSDGAYGIYVSLGQLKAGETKSAIFYYGASTADQLKPLSRAASALKVHQKSFHSNELLVWDVDRCNMQKANSSVDCDLAHSCYGTLWNSRSACRVMLVNTMTIAELKNYICGNSTCAYEARDARKECEAMYPNDMGWLDPIHHYRHRYCGIDGHATDLINDHDTCASLHSPVETHFCKTVRKCYKGFEQVGTSCKVDLPTMAQMQTELCSVTCREAIDQVLRGCGHYRVVRDAADSVTAYQRYFGCDQGASLPAPVLVESPLELQVEASTGDFWHSKAATYLTSVYEHCTSSATPASEATGEACQKAVKCFDKLQEAQESCGVIWLPTMTVTEVSKYVCSGSICHGHALHLQENCSHYHRVAAVLRPVAFYQEKYCPSWEQDKTHYRDPDLVNDLYLCTIRKHKRESPLCTTVIQCNEQISAVDRQCSGNAGTTEETMDLVCSNPCRSFIESAAMYCANYSYLMHSLQAYKVYMNVFECNSAVEDENPVAACIRSWKMRVRRILNSAGSTAGSGWRTADSA
ncbi:unnamed protein product [Cladocopium goreaui]|uniref:Uncharacterized protein n=1 Tax=Cladocopium goreaui TaxID=2562237 RepID=A0A9P1BY89_9DINO|nr:unnamed protein product [Cladocopium goreaui]